MFYTLSNLVHFSFLSSRHEWPTFTLHCLLHMMGLGQSVKWKEGVSSGSLDLSRNGGNASKVFLFLCRFQTEIQFENCLQIRTLYQLMFWENDTGNRKQLQNSFLFFPSKPVASQEEGGGGRYLQWPLGEKNTFIVHQPRPSARTQPSVVTSWSAAALADQDPHTLLLSFSA